MQEWYRLIVEKVFMPLIVFLPFSIAKLKPSFKKSKGPSHMIFKSISFSTTKFIRDSTWFRQSLLF